MYCQDEIAHLQQSLIDQDKEDGKTDDGKRLLASRRKYNHRNDQFPQNALIERIGIKLKEYGKRCWLLSIWQ